MSFSCQAGARGRLRPATIQTQPNAGSLRRRRFTLAAVAAALLALPAASPADQALTLSVYATAGDVQRYLATTADREQVLPVLRRLQVSRVFLEGRRGDEYVPPGMLAEIRDFLTAHGLRASGGIATVPGGHFGVRQNGALGWLNWESAATRRDVTAFFAEDAPVFNELIVDDFFCTADTSPDSERGRNGRPWGDYRRDLLVSLIDPLMRQPARAARPSARLILKFPQWYDRFHLFGYDPPRMASAFEEIWVGTEVRDPRTRRMGFVQPTEGYVNFRWLSSVAGDKVRGAWFDHIECSAQSFVDQAYLSVLGGAQELTLFHLGDLVDGHPGDALLAACLPELRDLAERVQGRSRSGVAFYKPAGGDGDENLFLADYLAMVGLPLLPEARYPESARVVVLAVQAAADPDILSRMRRHLRRGGTLVLTPAFVRRAGPAAAELAGVETGVTSEPAATTRVRAGRRIVPCPVPLDIDAHLQATRCEVLLGADGAIPLLTSRKSGPGRVLVLNVRTFAEQDYRDTGEWLLAPKPRGLAEIPQPVADALRRPLLEPLGLRFEGPAGVALCLFRQARSLYNFRDEPVTVRLDGERLELGANRLLWRASREPRRRPRT